VIVPWAAGASTRADDEGPAVNPFSNLFSYDKLAAAERSPQYANFVRQIFLNASYDVALFLDRGIFGAPSAIPSGRQHIFAPFFGGPDDRAALELVVQMCQHPGVTASIVRIHRSAEPTEEDNESASGGASSKGSLSEKHSNLPLTIHGGAHQGDTVYAHHSEGAQLQSETADNLAIAHFFGSDTTSLSSSLLSALKRTTFTESRTSAPLRTALKLASQAAAASDTPLLVITGRGRRQAMSHREELEQYLKEHVASSGSGISSLGLAGSSEVRKSLGEAASALLVSAVSGSLVVVQAGLGKGKAQTSV